jgi:hypothetical protein
MPHDHRDPPPWNPPAKPPVRPGWPLNINRKPGPDVPCPSVEVDPSLGPVVQTIVLSVVRLETRNKHLYKDRENLLDLVSSAYWRLKDRIPLSNDARNARDQVIRLLEDALVEAGRLPDEDGA